MGYDNTTHYFSLEDNDTPENPHKEKCVTSPKKLFGMLAYAGLTAFLGYLSHTTKEKHSDNVGTWDTSTPPNNESCYDIYGGITDSGTILPYILNISQTSSELLQVCDELQNSISSESTMLALYQGTMIASISMLVMLLIHLFPTKKEEDPSDDHDDHQYSADEIELLKNNKFTQHEDTPSDDASKACIDVFRTLRKYLDRNTAGIVLEYAPYQPELALYQKIKEKTSEATSCEARLLRMGTALLRPQSFTSKIVHYPIFFTICFLVQYLLKKAIEEIQQSNEAEDKIWKQSPIGPYFNTTCAILYGSPSSHSQQSYERPCNQISTFINQINLEVWVPLIASVITLILFIRYFCEKGGAAALEPEIEEIYTSNEIGQLQDIKGLRAWTLTRECAQQIEESCSQKITELTDSFSSEQYTTVSLHYP